MAQVTIASTTIPNWKGPTSGVGLAVIPLNPFTSAAGTIHPAGVGLPNLGSAFDSFACTVSAGTLTIPAVTVDSTTDAVDNPTARYAAYFYNTGNGKVIQPLGEFYSFAVPPTPASTTWSALAAMNVTNLPTSLPGFQWQGAWSGTASYPANSAVARGGSSYISLQPNTNVDPATDDGTHWAPLALAGASGGGLSSSTPLAPSGAGNVGTATLAARADHVHPAQVNGSYSVTQDITVGGNVIGRTIRLSQGATITDASGNSYGAAYAIVDSIGNIALAIMPDGSTRLMGNASIYGNLLLGTAGGGIQALGTNGLNAAWAVMDAISNVALYVDGAGNTTVAGSLTVSGALNANVTATAALIGGSLLAAMAAPGSQGNVNGYPFAIMDAVQKIALAIDPQGYLHGHFAFDPLSKCVQDNYGGLYYTKRDSSGNYQIYYLAVGGSEQQLTSVGNNGNPSIAPDGSILYMSDASGTLSHMRMGPSGENPVPVGGTNTQLLAEADYNVIIITGQSVANGYGSAPTPCISTTQPFSNLMLGPDPRGGAAMFENGSGVALDCSSLALNPLTAGPVVPDTGLYYWGETQANGIADSLSRMFAMRGYKGQFVVLVSAGNGDEYTLIKKNGTYPFYANAMAMLTRVVQLATAASKKVSVRAVVTVTGDGDQAHNTPGPQETANMLQFQKDYETDCMAITGQKNGVPLVQSTNCVVNSASNWIYISEAQIEASEQSGGKVVLYGPRYQFPYCDAFGSDYAHMTPDGYRNHGENIAKAVFAAIQNQPWTGVRPKSWRLLANRVIVDFYVPVPPLRLDTTTLAAVPTTSGAGYFPGGLYGFEFDDASGAPPTITALNFLSPTTVELILSAAPTGPTPTISYGTHAPTFHRAYGNLCDSDNSPSLYGYTNTANWCPSFVKSLSY